MHFEFHDASFEFRLWWVFCLSVFEKRRFHLLVLVLNILMRTGELKEFCIFYCGNHWVKSTNFATTLSSYVSLLANFGSCSKHAIKNVTDRRAQSEPECVLPREAIFSFKSGDRRALIEFETRRKFLAPGIGCRHERVSMRISVWYRSVWECMFDCDVMFGLLLSRFVI